MIPHYETGKYTDNSSFLPDDEYAKILDNIVKACVDVIVTNDKHQILLGKRNVFPMKDYWYGCGGRMRVNESPIDSAHRLLKRELGITQFQPIRYVTTHSYVWKMRDQEPKDHGTCDISILTTMKLLNEQIDHIKLDNKEYDQVEWVNMDEILNNKKYHIAIRRGVYMLKKLSYQDKIESLTAEYIQCNEISKKDRINQELLQLNVEYYKYCHNQLANEFHQQEKFFIDDTYQY